MVHIPCWDYTRIWCITHLFWFLWSLVQHGALNSLVEPIWLGAALEGTLAPFAKSTLGAQSQDGRAGPCVGAGTARGLPTRRCETAISDFAGGFRKFIEDFYSSCRTRLVFLCILAAGSCLVIVGGG